MDGIEIHFRREFWEAEAILFQARRVPRRPAIVGVQGNKLAQQQRDFRGRKVSEVIFDLWPLAGCPRVFKAITDPIHASCQGG
jgi:hypothetical protein